SSTLSLDFCRWLILARTPMGRSSLLLRFLARGLTASTSCLVRSLLAWMWSRRLRLLDRRMESPRRRLLLRIAAS
ncbi:hypothetical protein GGF37_007243, partial [Kickxella alabastrina]